VSATAEPTVSVEERNKQVVTELYRIKNERDYDALDAIMHPDFSATFARHFGDDEPFTPNYLKEKWWAYVGAFPDLFYDVHALVAEGEWVVARLHYRGTHEGVLSGFEPTGKSINVNQHLSIRLADGKIIEMHSTADFLTGLWKPLGITPPMGD
jgi:predicted ester cyclase